MQGGTTDLSEAWIWETEAAFLAKPCFDYDLLNIAFPGLQFLHRMNMDEIVLFARYIELLWISNERTNLKVFTKNKLYNFIVRTVIHVMKLIYSAHLNFLKLLCKTLSGRLSFYKKTKKKNCIWPVWVFGETCGVFSCSMWDLVPWPGIEHPAPCIGSTESYLPDLQESP